jgi:hypothetical protein
MLRKLGARRQYDELPHDHGRDGNAALSQDLHNASLSAFYNTFDDVLDTEMIIASLRRARSARAAWRGRQRGRRGE